MPTAHSFRLSLLSVLLFLSLPNRQRLSMGENSETTQSRRRRHRTLDHSRRPGDPTPTQRRRHCDLTPTVVALPYPLKAEAHKTPDSVPLVSLTLRRSSSSRCSPIRVSDVIVRVRLHSRLKFVRLQPLSTACIKVAQAISARPAM
ncbi:hypothetical protein CRG98_044115 [Punica granatum]|uniref:Secreted protein n=1 Tax=Punica granatum TaxID=22663 RepID=A0A2I0HUW2_PUNGR|nr:hypothetical protein CRG98_044115 [Punica granatum]